MFFRFTLKNISIIKTTEGCDISFNFRLKIISWACLLGSGLKLIFHWNAQLLTFFKSLFISFAAVLMLCATLKRDVSSANKCRLEQLIIPYSVYYSTKIIDCLFMTLSTYLLTFWVEFVLFSMNKELSPNFPFYINPSRPDPERREKNQLKFLFSHFFVVPEKVLWNLLRHQKEVWK